MRSSRAHGSLTLDPLAQGAALRLRKPALALLFACASAGAARAQLSGGDILLSVFTGGTRVECVHPDGTGVWTSTGGTGSNWEGASLTPLGHVVTTRRAPQFGVNVFDANGVEIGSFATPQVTQIPGDVSVFADGTLAVTDQGGMVHLYTEAGVFVSSMVPAGSLHPFGSHVDRHDNLFLCDISGAQPNQGQIQKLSRTGQLLLTIPLTYPAGDLIVAPDDTWWVADRANRTVKHLDAAGAPLGEFQVAVSGQFAGIAMATDGTLYVTAESSSQIFHYTTAGALLGSFVIPGPSFGTPLFMSIALCGGDATTYCTPKVNSIGCTPAIAATGTASASATSGFTVSATNVRNQKAGLLLYSVTGRNNAPFQGGFLCVLPPVRRTPGTLSGGTPLPASDCTGVYAIDMNAFAHGVLGGNPLPALTVLGTFVDAQWWGRDPGFPFPNNSTLTNGIEYFICN